MTSQSADMISLLLVQFSCQYHYYHRLSFGDGLVRDTKLGTNVSNEILLNAAKCHGYGFYRFLVIMGKTTRLNANSPKVKQRKKHFQILIKR